LSHTSVRLVAMPTSTDSAPAKRSGASSAAGLALYGLTLALELALGASTRWLLAYLGASALGAILPLGLTPEGCAWVAALAPVAFSLLGFLLPGRGVVWGRRLGIRRPSREEEASIGDALHFLHSAAPASAGPAEFRVLDVPLPCAAVRGRVVVLSRPLVESDALAAVLAHELAHLRSLDGRLIEALDRLSLWDDPLSPAVTGRREQPAPNPERRGGTAWATLRLLARLTGGSIARRALAPAWAAHWRAREYAADAYAACLGQAEDLADHLRDLHQPLDPPARGIFNPREHPPVALRIERLAGALQWRRVDMSLRRVLRWMSRLCQHSGIEIPECSCRECLEGLLWVYAPALLDAGPLEQPCCTPAFGTDSAQAKTKDPRLRQPTEVGVR
jgi:Zn-dependent protease with chaperone function